MFGYLILLVQIFTVLFLYFLLSFKFRLSSNTSNVSVFDYISRHLEVRQKYTVVLEILVKRSLVFDVTGYIVAKTFPYMCPVLRIRIYFGSQFCFQEMFFFFIFFIFKKKVSLHKKFFLVYSTNKKLFPSSEALYSVLVFCNVVVSFSNWAIMNFSETSFFLSWRVLQL